MRIKDALKMYDNVSCRESLKLSKETLEEISNSVTDPTGLKPFMNEQIEQYDKLIEQVDMLQTSLQKQITFAKQEKQNRIKGDIANMEFTKKWNRINFIISTAAMLFAFGAFVISLLEHFEI